MERISEAEASRGRARDPHAEVRTILGSAVRARIRNDDRKRPAADPAVVRSRERRSPSVKIDGVLHEFSSVPGVVEDTTDIILNLKQIPFRCHSDHARDARGPRRGTARR